jgi:two-component system autoinducer 2 sensor kinase/phosphatase LuxQ
MSQGIVQLQLAAHYLQDETLRPAAQLFQAKAFAKGLAFEFITDIASDVCVMTDRVRLSQIVFNLLTNAIKFTDKGGIRFTTTLRPRPHSTLQELHIKVDDTGLGIPEKELPTIFDVFEQGYVGLDRGGSGLGLAIAKQLVNLMNGDISVKSYVDTCCGALLLPCFFCH